MEAFKEILQRAKELIGKCKDREKIKKYIVTLDTLGKHSYVEIEFLKQRSDALGIPIDQSEFKEYREIQKAMYLSSSI